MNVHVKKDFGQLRDEMVEKASSLGASAPNWS